MRPPRVRSSAVLSASTTVHVHWLLPVLPPIFGLHVVERTVLAFLHAGVRIYRIRSEAARGSV